MTFWRKIKILLSNIKSIGYCLLKIAVLLCAVLLCAVLFSHHDREIKLVLHGKRDAFFKSSDSIGMCWNSKILRYTAWLWNYSPKCHFVTYYSHFRVLGNLAKIFGLNRGKTPKKNANFDFWSLISKITKMWRLSCSPKITAPPCMTKMCMLHYNRWWRINISTTTDADIITQLHNHSDSTVIPEN